MIFCAPFMYSLKELSLNNADYGKSGMMAVISLIRTGAWLEGLSLDIKADIAGFVNYLAWWRLPGKLKHLAVGPRLSPEEVAVIDSHEQFTNAFQTITMY